MKQDNKLKMEVTAWLMLARHHYEALEMIRGTLQDLVGEHDNYGHVGDFVYSGNINATSLLERVAEREKMLRK